MEYFDMRKMSVNLWRNAAGETREICTFPPAKRDFYWRASIASIAANGEFSLFPGMERIVTLLEGGEMFLESADRFNHTLKPLQPFAFAADQVVKAKLTAGQMSMDFNIMTRLDVCKAKVRIAERTFTRRGGVCNKRGVAIGRQTAHYRPGRVLVRWQAHPAAFTTARQTVVQ